MRRLLRRLVRWAGRATAPRRTTFPMATLTFVVYRNGEQIGRHTLSFKARHATASRSTSIDFSVKVLGVTAYRYTHRGNEVWAGGMLQSLDARTDDNGKQYTCASSATGNGLLVEREALPIPFCRRPAHQGVQLPEVARTLPPSTLPTSNWNMGQVNPIRAAQHAVRHPVQCPGGTPMGREPVKTATGATIEATRYHYTGDIRMDQWFDDRGRWVKAAFTAFDGSTIEYILQE